MSVSKYNPELNICTSFSQRMPQESDHVSVITARADGAVCTHTK